jgi:hypothetical protein
LNIMPASHFDVKSMTGRPKFIVRHTQVKISAPLSKTHCISKILYTDI